MEAKELPYLLIKKKRVAQFIYRKPGKNRNNHEQTTTPRDNPTQETTRPQTLPTKGTPTTHRR
jgi:hypothetical protein